MSGQLEEPIEVRDVIHEVDYIQECVHEVRTIQYEEVVRHQPKIEVQTVEKIIEVPEIRSVQRVVEVPHVQEVVRRVPRVMVVEVPVEREVIKVIEDVYVPVPLHAFHKNIHHSTFTLKRLSSIKMLMNFDRYVPVAEV